ncbi:glycosyltransferase family 2 protein [Microvirga sp. 0TCS3.31]
MQSDVSAPARPMIGLIDFHSQSDTERCIDSILATAAEDIDIVVVDNGQDFQSDDPRVRTIRPHRNVGFAGGCNLLLSSARDSDAPWLWLLNNDCTLEEGWPEHLSVALQRSAADLVTTVTLLGDSDRVWFGGGEYREKTNRQHHAYYGEDIANVSLPEISATAWASGANIVVRRHVLEANLPFDEDLFLYREEFDWQRRNRLTVDLVGWPLVRHYAGSTTGTTGGNLEAYFSARNSWVTGHRYLSRSNLPLFRGAWLWDFVLKPVLRRDWTAARAAYLGWRNRHVAGHAALESYISLSRANTEGTP